MDDSIASLLEKAGDGKISRVAAQCQAEQDRTDVAAVRARMARYLDVMRDSVRVGMNAERRSLSGLTGGQAARLFDAAAQGKTAGGPLLARAAARACADASRAGTFRSRSKRRLVFRRKARSKESSG